MTRKKKSSEDFWTAAATANLKIWIGAVDALCKWHLYTSWNDLCGDAAPLEEAFEADITPLAFVQEWARKYGLDWR